MKDLEEKLDRARQDLLDLGLRNPLISFKATRSTLPIVDELSEEILRILVSDSKRMSFSALPNAVEEELDQLGYDRDLDWSGIFANDDDDRSDGTLASRHTDTKLQTNLGAEPLTLRLIKINSTATTYIEEQGVNVLYLALAFLHWYEAPSSENLRKAPLILIPVELERSNARERFKVRHTGDDVGDNLSLRAKLRNDFDIALPEYNPESDEPLSAYMQKVAKAVEREPRWKVAADEIHLGFFSFGKFLMYNDLDVGTWSSAGIGDSHPLISPLLGDGFRHPGTSIPDDAHLDEILAPDALHTVMDADSSQTKAILDVQSGRNLVIQGPPGTGKSQTITNLIAEAVGSGKKVLFVSEKMAALDVVKRRLDKVGIGDAALELHSHKTNKKLLAAELDRTLQLGRPQNKRDDDDIALLTRLRDQLNAYCNAANERVGDSGLTPVEALGHILRLETDGSHSSRFSFEEMQSWTGADYREARVVVGELSRKLDQMGRPSKSPFWGSQLEYFDPLSQQRLAQALQEAISALETARTRGQALATRLRFENPQRLDDIAVLCRAATRSIDAPHDIFAAHLTTGDWQARRDDLRELIESGKAAHEIEEQYKGQLIPEAWDQDLLEVRQHYAEYGKKWWRGLSGKFRSARSRLRGLCTGELPKDADACLEIVDAIMAMRREREVIDRHSSLGSALFRSQWQGRASDWSVLERINDWVVSLYGDIGDGDLPPAIVDFLAASPSLTDLSDVISGVDSAQAELDAALKAADELLENSASHSILAPQGEGGPTPTLAQIQRRLELWSSNLDALQWMTEFNRIGKSLAELGLHSVLKRGAGWDASGAELERSFDLTWFEGVYQRAASERPALSGFDRTSHEFAIENFRKLDALLLTHVRNRLIMSHWEELPRLGQSGELGIIQKEINKKRRHFPIRKLIKEAGRAVQAIKPLFMMSPMSIATYLPPGSVKFDLVIFDEASQVKPVDAFGALLRAEQAVVVGDSKQLPPTSFFDSEIAPDDEDDDVVTGDQESILGLFNSQSAPSRMLSWHYRSRHESLIAVSNHELYDDRLVVFPSPGQETAATGLTFHHLPDTEYDRGRTRSNRGEARAVVEAVFEHARQFPNLTIGAVTFSAAQRDAVEIELEARRRRDPSCEDFFNSHEEEPFFVKNLENVQGDERDVILISVGYGKTAEGYFARNFGPVNREGGDRRLNVLFSRARMSCRVFSNFKADEIDTSPPNTPRGVHVLKAFMQYAETRVLETPKITGRAPDSPFEEQVLAMLTSRGLDIEPQLGVAGFFIDLAVRDPENPSRYLLGIECDGATYHSARSARDRDRLREAVLRNLGWEIHRIWSSDWFRNPERETERVLKAVEEAKLQHARRAARTGLVQTSDRASTDTPIRSDESKQDEGPSSSSAKPYIKANLSVRLGGREINEVGRERIAEWVATVVEIEAPVHVEEVIRRIASAAGYSRAGNRIQNALREGIAYAQRGSRVALKGEFLWRNGDDSAPTRNRAELDSTSKKIEYTCDAELRNALLNAVGEAFSATEAEAVSLALSNLGHQRPRADTRHRADALLQSMKAQGLVTESQGKISLPR